MAMRTDTDLSRTPLSGWVVLLGYSAAVAAVAVGIDRLRRGQQR